jgi:hypothetical protein
MWHDPAFWYQYKIEVSADDRQWTTAVDMTRNTEVKWVPIHAFTAKDVRYLRVTVTGMENGCWLGVREVEVFDTLPGEGEGVEKGEKGEKGSVRRC